MSERQSVYQTKWSRKPKKGKTPMQIEYEDQCALFRWRDEMVKSIPELALLNASLNGVRLTIGQAVKAKKMGMSRGFPDLNLPVARGEHHGLFIELKALPYVNQDGKKIVPRLSAEQEGWLIALKQQGYNAVVCRGFDDAKKTILAYLMGV